MAVRNTASPGEVGARVEERGQLARTYGSQRVGGDEVPRDVISGLGYVNINKLSGDGSPIETSRLSVTSNLTTDGRGVTTAKPPFTTASVTAQAIHHKPGDTDAVMAVAPVVPGASGPTIDTDRAKFYTATWNADKKAFVQGAEIPRPAAGTPMSAGMANSLAIMTDANDTNLTGGIVRPDFNKGGTLVVGSAEQARPRAAGPTMQG